MPPASAASAFGQERSPCVPISPRTSHAGDPGGRSHHMSAHNFIGSADLKSSCAVILPGDHDACPDRVDWPSTGAGREICHLVMQHHACRAQELAYRGSGLAGQELDVGGGKAAAHIKLFGQIAAELRRDGEPLPDGPPGGTWRRPCRVRTRCTSADP